MNNLNHNFKELYTFKNDFGNLRQEIEDKVELANEVQSIVDNTSYEIGVNFGDVNIEEDNASGVIKTLTVFLKSGDSPIVISDHNFTLERNTVLYIDLADATPTLKKGNQVITSAATYGAGAFYLDKKILILANHYGSWIGAISGQFLAAANKVKIGDNPNLMAQKVGDDYFVYVKSKLNDLRYARYKIEYKEQAYAAGEIRSNVKVHTINEVMNVARNVDGTFNEYSQIAQSGAWDLAIRESGVSDGSGGIAHGDEIEGHFTVLVDGIEISNVSEELAAYNTLEFISGSTVYRDSQTYSTLTPLATHTKSYLFESDRMGSMEMDSKLIMQRDASLLYAYLSMAPVTKTYTNRAISDIDSETNILTSPAPTHEWRENIRKITVYGTNVSVSAEVLEQETPGTPVAKVEEVHYNKIYFNSVTNGQSVSAGDVLRTKSLFNISLR